MPWRLTIKLACSDALELPPTQTSKVAGLCHPRFVCGTPVGQFVSTERHANCRLNVRLQRDALEAFEFAHRPRSATRLLVNVELRHLVSGGGSGICHIKADFNGFPWFDLCAAQFKV